MTEQALEFLDNGVPRQNEVDDDVLISQDNLVLTDIINDAYYGNEFVPVIVAAPYGYGKSSYLMKVLAETHAKKRRIKELNGKCMKIRDFSIETIGKWMKFHPKDVIDLWLSINDKEIDFGWDDAGYWLNAMSWQHPFSKAIQKYYNVVRTDFGAMIFTTPTFSWVIKKIREMESMIYIEIHKISDCPIHINVEDAKPTTRIALGFNYSDLRNNIYSPPRFVDVFDVMLPDTLYNWYYPLRKMYAKQAKLLVQAELQTLREMNIEGGA